VVEPTDRALFIRPVKGRSRTENAFREIFRDVPGVVRNSLDVGSQRDDLQIRSQTSKVQVQVQLEKMGRQCAFRLL
jgi:hypothetical protein